MVFIFETKIEKIKLKSNQFEKKPTRTEAPTLSSASDLWLLGPHPKGFLFRARFLRKGTNDQSSDRERSLLINT